MAEKQIVFGLHAVEALLESNPDRVLRLCVVRERQDKKIESLVQLAKSQDIAIEWESKQTLDKLTGSGTHQGIAAFCKKPSTLNEEDLKSLLQSVKAPLLLVLDGVQDPHNLGACFRTADAAGVTAIIAPRDKAVGITPVVSKVASGAVETVPFIQVTNIARTLEMLKELGIWIYGAAGEAKQTLYQTDLRGPAAIVMGAEGDGLRRLTKDTCDVLVKIPMAGTVASLNVSVATAVFLFEVVRQRAGK
jgi:23S rRNA (guanosine2251-2'-O)-methyltransferase